MSQMPEIKPVVNKEPERDKKKAGLLARLFGGGGSGGSAGLGGFGGGAGGGMGGLAGGGILATKAGLIALILVGTTVAGGIGMVGYRLFGPGADATGNGDNLQLFAAKPKDAPVADGAPKDGTSASLQYLNQANSQPKAPDAAASDAPKDATAAGATAAADAAASATGPLNKAGNTDNGVNKGLLKTAGKFGTLTAPGGGGGSGAAASSAPQKAAGANDLAAGSRGSISGFKKTASSVSGGTARSIAGRQFGGAAGQAFGVLHSNQGAQSSYAAGQTYDGSAAGGSNINGAGTPIGGPGTTSGGGAAQPKSLAAPASLDSNTSSSVPTPPGTPLCPWQSQIQQAQMLIGVATAILLACSLINKAKTPWTMTLVKILGGVVAAIGVMVAVIGGAITHGKYHQVLQGGILGAAGAGLVLAGAMVAFSDTTNKNAAGQTLTPDSDGDPEVAGSPDADTDTATSNNNALSGNGSGDIMSANPFVLIGGGVGLVGLAGTMMMPGTKYPAQDANDPNWPKGGLLGYEYQMKAVPSEQALKKMVA